MAEQSRCQYCNERTSVTMDDGVNLWQQETGKTVCNRCEATRKIVREEIAELAKQIQSANPFESERLAQQIKESVMAGIRATRSSLISMI